MNYMDYKATISWLQIIDEDRTGDGYWAGNLQPKVMTRLFKRDLVEFRSIETGKPAEHIVLTDFGHDILSAARQAGLQPK